MHKLRNMLVAVALGTIGCSANVFAEDVEGAGFLDVAKDAGFAEYIFPLVLLAGVVLVVLVIVKKHKKNKGGKP